MERLGTGMLRKPSEAVSKSQFVGWPKQDFSPLLQSKPEFTEACAVKVNVASQQEDLVAGEHFC